MNNRSCGDNDVIVAQCTPSGSGALALLRICGNGSIELVDTIAQLKDGKKLSMQKTHTIHFGTVTSGNTVPIDHVLFLLMHGPHTFTGQDTIEITCHNNQFIIESIIQQVITRGARHAGPGEFSKRSVMNGKMDLLQAEAVDELIHANTQHALQKSLEQLEGSFSYFIKTIEDQLMHTAVLAQASFEFVEEENFAFASDIQLILREVRTKIQKIKENFDMQQHIRQGIRVALIGSVNAGKSSLFNALLGKNRAIVADIAGTTRDVIEAGIYINGNYCTLVDTAGLRITHDLIEQEGIKRSLEQAQSADIILLVFDASTPLHEQEIIAYNDIMNAYRHKVIMVYNKADLGCILEDSHALPLSAIQKNGIDQLLVIIKEKMSALLHTLDSPFLLNKRHYHTLSTVCVSIEAALDLLQQQSVAYELISFHVYDALSQLADLTGKSVSESVMDQVFRHFCVGK